MGKVFLALLLVVAAGTLACSGGNSIIGGAGELKCPEGIIWERESPEDAVMAVICLNTNRSLEFKDIVVEETGEDAVLVTVLADEFGCVGCPRELECVHEVFYQRQNKLWKPQNIAYDMCDLSSSSAQATAVTERQRVEQLVDGYQITINSAHADRTYRGIEVLMNQTPVGFESGIRLKGRVIYNNKEYDIQNISTDDASDGIQLFTFATSSPDTGLRANRGATILWIQVYWTEGFCRLDCGKPDYDGPIFTP